MTTATLTPANPATPPLPLSFYLPRGPVSPWPRGGDTTPDTGARDVATPKRREFWRAVAAAVSRLRAPAADTIISWSMAATVALVAVDAAIVSYSHIYGLATGHWGTGAETGIQARLLPLSIDGVIIEASLVKLYRARHKVAGKAKLATAMLLLGIGATVAANVIHGLPPSMLAPVVHTVIMAALSAWPAGALIGSVEMAMGLVRDKQAVAEGDTDDAGDKRPRRRFRLRRPKSKQPRRPAARLPAKGPGSQPPADRVAKAISGSKSWKADGCLSVDDKKTIATTLRVTPRTVERRAAKMAAQAKGKP